MILRTPARVAALVLGALCLYAALLVPHHPSALSWTAFARVPLEWPVLLLLMIAVGGSARWLRLGLAILLTGVVALKLANVALFEAFSRPFNLVLDSFVFGASFNLLSGAVGWWSAVAVVTLAVLAVPLLVWILFRALGVWSRTPWPRGLHRASLLALPLAAALAVADAGHALGYWALERSPPGQTFSTRVLVSQVESSRQAAVQLAAFRAQAATDDIADLAAPFAALNGRDVHIIFIESYGRASFDNPLYRDLHPDLLRQAAGTLAAQGLQSRSGWLTSPIAGGQSWLAHGTLNSGLMTDNQASYVAMLSSARKSLHHLAREAGYRSAAVMPAITLPWPEGPMIGFERILEAKDLGYQGLPFNWVTMPDQYTLSVYDDLLGPDPRPDFLQIALISSHAPWVPIPPMLPWEEIGDGRVFNQYATAGDPPSVVWRDRDRVRAQYRKSIDYALSASLSHIARQAGPEAPLVILLGDHQAGSWIAQSDSRDVPIHLIGPPEVLALFDAWAFTPGLVPDAASPVWPMEAFRARFLRAVSGAASS